MGDKFDVRAAAEAAAVEWYGDEGPVTFHDPHTAPGALVRRLTNCIARHFAPLADPAAALDMAIDAYEQHYNATTPDEQKAKDKASAERAVNRAVQASALLDAYHAREKYSEGDPRRCASLTPNDPATIATLADENGRLAAFATWVRDEAPEQWSLLQGQGMPEDYELLLADVHKRARAALAATDAEEGSDA